ncbi:putative OPA3-like protein CG13603 [Teleopsis dalmanni]|uniref:putative OPA3-like protein CG13603 n=1 Tax=Teleopsis dalmanni TaxID=139649 RepID=UPI0018CD1351|nr:putative OPA3-like protein CG13603 [Teleopsis dalmanni]
MVIGAFPAAKLGILAIKQISKPVANVIKANAKQSPTFRKYICMPPAQFYNWVEVKTKMWALNLGRPVTVPPLNEAMAIELGANLLGEFIIFAIGAGLLILEYARQSKNEYKKQETQKQDRAALVTQLSEMGFRLERQDAQIRELTRALADVDSRSIFKWHKEAIPEYKTFDPNTPDQTSRVTKNFQGLYNPAEGNLFKSLNFLETQIFGNRQKHQQQQQHPLLEMSNVTDTESSTEVVYTNENLTVQPELTPIEQNSEVNITLEQEKN